MNSTAPVPPEGDATPRVCLPPVETDGGVELQLPITPGLDLSRLTEDEQIELYDELVRLEGSKLSTDFRSYLREAWSVADPSEFVPTWHVDAIAEHLEAVTRGQIRRLLINIPPRMGKSVEASVLWPTWEWTRNPQGRWMFVSYSGMLSNKHSVERRNVIESDWYQARWEHLFKLSSDQNVKTEFTNDARGAMFATSIGGTATGYGGDRIVFDDPHNVERVESDEVRENVITSYQRTFSTRLNDAKTGAIVVIMQRLHERDLTGHLLDAEPGQWTHLCLPMEFEKKHFAFYIRDPRKEDGELLCAQRFGPNEVANAKLRGSYAYAGQYQQRPAPASGGILNRNWWKFYDLEPRALGCNSIVISLDCAFKGLDDSDYVVLQVWGRKDANFYLLDQVRDQMNFPATQHALQAMATKWPEAMAKLIEDKANGPALIDTMRSKIPGLIAIEPRGSKEARASAVSPFIEAGNVFLPSAAPWLQDFLAECSSFPKGPNDDQVDAMTQALDRLANSGDGAADWYEMKNRERAAAVQAAAKEQ